MKYPLTELTFYLLFVGHKYQHVGHIWLLGLQLDNPGNVSHQMNVFCIFIFYMRETRCLHLLRELPCFGNMKNYDMNLCLNQ